MYYMICTTPGVSYALGVTRKYQLDPSKGHWVVVKNILKYLRRTKNIFLIYGYGDNDHHVKGYRDANFQSDRDDTKS